MSLLGLHSELYWTNVLIKLWCNHSLQRKFKSQTHHTMKEFKHSNWLSPPELTYVCRQLPTFERSVDWDRWWLYVTDARIYRWRCTRDVTNKRSSFCVHRQDGVWCSQNHCGALVDWTVDINILSLYIAANTWQIKQQRVELKACVYIYHSCRWLCNSY